MADSSDTKFLNAAEAASLLRSFAIVLSKAGAQSDADKFDRIAAGLETATSDELRTARIEKYKTQLAAWEADVKYVLDWRLESFRGTLALAQRAISSAMLVNGGAAIALLAYMGNTKATATAFVPPLMWFASGVFIAAATFALSYFSQLYYTANAPRETAIGVRFHVATVVAGVLSYVVFVGGIMCSPAAFDRASATVSTQPAQEERRNAPPPKAPGPAPAYPAQPPAQQPARKADGG